MNISDELNNFGLNPNNSVIIGSGILSALGIRESHDIDVIVTSQKYDQLKATGQFTKKLAHGRSILASQDSEITASWNVLGRNYTYLDLLPESTIIKSVRYISLNFLYQVKKSWLIDSDVRPKDIKDVEIIEQYLKDPTNLPAQIPDFIRVILNLSEYDQYLLQRDRDTNGEDKVAVAEWETSRSQNIKKVMEIVDKIGLIGFNKYGERAYMAVWVIVQHGTEADVTLMQKYLELMKSNSQECHLQQIAYLTDKILRLQGKKQIYGSQMTTDSEGRNIPAPLEDPEHVDERRVTMGMGTLAEYLA